MEYSVITVTVLMQNCSLLWCPESKRGAVVDPGGESERILAAIRKEEVELEKVLLTHLHIDHVGAAGALAARCGASIEGPQEGDRFLLGTLQQQAEMFGVELEQVFAPDRWLGEGDSVSFGKVELKVRHCPGHTPGHVIFFHAGTRLGITGDLLFQGSIGRTDFPGGDHQALLDSIRAQLWPLGDDVAFIPGHGPMSTFGEERRFNLFVGDGR